MGSLMGVWWQIVEVLCSDRLKMGNSWSKRVFRADCEEVFGLGLLPLLPHVIITCRKLWPFVGSYLLAASVIDLLLSVALVKLATYDT